jgi:23S rRNA (cytosine1962-C5)-methyltransferase
MDSHRLDRVPSPSTTRVAVRLTPDALRHVRGGHPWVFDGSIADVSNPDAAVGDLAVVFDRDRRFRAIGLWDPTSPIRLRILHHGHPTTIDAAWYASRIRAAVDRREPIASRGDTTGYRVIHGENDGLPGLVVDRYGSVLVVRLDTAAWVPHLRTVLPLVREAVPARSIVVRFSRQVAESARHGLVDGETVVGDPVDGPVPFLEHGLRVTAEVVSGQKTGWFLDQRDNRALAATHARGVDVLDAFCNAGGFAVHAAAAGARSVHLVDQSRHAIDAAVQHLETNRPADGRLTVTSSVADAFEELAALGTARRRFGLVIVDPPSFAHDAASVPRALEAHARLTALAVPLVARDGVIVQASCTSRIAAADLARAMHRGAANAGVDLVEVERTAHAIDHPIGFPEGAYLNAIVARVERIARPPSRRGGAPSRPSTSATRTS